MSTPAEGVRPPLAVAFATAGFAALAICGFGFTSLLADLDVVAVPGLGNIPGIAAMLLTGAAFVLTEGIAVRRRSYVDSVFVTAAVVLAYLVGLLAGGVFAGVDASRAAAAAAGFATSWFCLILAAAAFVAAWAGVAMVRTRSRRPQWPWEGEDED